MKITKWLFDDRFLAERTFAKQFGIKATHVDLLVDYMFAAAHQEARSYKR